MEGVIPNSKVVIYPPPNIDGSWHRELYLRPGAWIPWVTLTVVVTVVLLAIVVFILHLNEKASYTKICYHHILIVNFSVKTSLNGEEHPITSILMRSKVIKSCIFL